MDIETVKAQLKKDIIAYITAQGVVDKALVKKALDAVRGNTFESMKIDADMLSERDLKSYIKDAGLKLDDDFYVRISYNFSAPHYGAMVGFVQRYEAISNAEFEQENKLNEALAEEWSDRSYYLDYDEMGGPEFAIVIFPDCVEVRAYESGVGDKIPKTDRKYTGSRDDIKWEFPLSSLDELKAAANRYGCPVIDTAELPKSVTK